MHDPEAKDEALAKRRAERDALRSDVLTGLGSPRERSTEELLAVYQAAQMAFDAWSPPGWIEHDHDDHSVFSMLDRESERAWFVMEAVVGELVNRWPDRINDRQELLCALADWQHKCDDEPEVAQAILKLVLASKHLRDAAA